MSNKNKCRACLMEGANYPIFENIESVGSIYSKLYQCLNENIEDKEGYPNKLCESCMTIIDTVHNFINKFKMSCKILETGIIVKQEMDIDNEPDQQIEIEIIKEEPVSDSDGLDPLEGDWKEKSEQKSHESPNTQINKREKRLLEIRAKIEALKQSKLNKAPSTSKAKTKATSTKVKTSGKRIRSGKAKKIKEESSTQCESGKPESEVPIEILCDLCGEVFDCKTKLSKHRAEAHFPMKCSQCPKFFASEHYYKRHMKRAHTAEKTFICEECGRAFAFRGELATHKKVVHLRLIKPKERPVCPKCNRSFSNKKTLLIHDRSAHTGLRPAVCKDCGASFFHEDYLKLHVRLHTGETPHKCPICGKGFSQSGNMRSHISHNHRLIDLSPETIKTLKPNYFKFLKKTYLKSSIKAKKSKEETSKQSKSESTVSEIPTEILCDICGEVFDCQKKLTKHRDQAHFPMKCSLCPKVLASEYYLKCHMKRVHTEEKPFICESCGRGFIFPGELATHNRVVHLRLIKPKTRPVCPKCNRSFSNKKILLIHDRSAHTGLRPAVCKDCGASFFHEDYLKLHVRLHTGETPHKCPICGKGFAQSGNMKSHISHNHSLADLSPEMVKTIKPRYLKFLKKS